MANHRPINEYDVIICGAGPSGSTCAAFLSDKNLRVLLLDKAIFPREKTCGGALSDKAVAMLKKLGLENQVAKYSTLMDGLVLIAPNHTKAHLFPPINAKITPGYTLRREIFDNLLFQNAKSKKNITTMENVEVIDVFFNSKGKAIGIRANTPKSEKTFLAKIIVGADGANSIVARKIGATNLDDRHWYVAERQYWSGITSIRESIEFHFIDSVLPGYFWIFKLPNGEANVGLGTLVSDVKKRNLNLTKLFEKVITEDPIISPRFKNAKPLAPLMGWRLPLATIHRKNYHAGVLLIGDAAGLVDPSSGEGISSAMVSGEIAAETISEAFRLGDYSAKMLSKYDKRLWGTIGAELSQSVFIQKLFIQKKLLNWFLENAASDKLASEVFSDAFFVENTRHSNRNLLDFIHLIFPHQSIREKITKARQGK